MWRDIVADAHLDARRPPGIDQSKRCVSPKACPPRRPERAQACLTGLLHETFDEQCRLVMGVVHRVTGRGAPQLLVDLRVHVGNLADAERGTERGEPLVGARGQGPQLSRLTMPTGLPIRASPARDGRQPTDATRYWRRPDTKHAPIHGWNNGRKEPVKPSPRAESS